MLRYEFVNFMEVTGGNYAALLSQPGVVKVFNQPSKSSSTRIEYQGGYLLEPGQSAYYIIPPEYHQLVVRDMILNHRKGPYGHGEPHMKYEPEKNKWRDYYGSYSRIEAHDTQTNKWYAYRIEGRDYKHAEYRQGGYETETLHDWLETGKIMPDIFRITNPGNRRAAPHPQTGEPIDPMDQRSTVDIGNISVILFDPEVWQEGETIQIQWAYSPQGYFMGQFTPLRFPNPRKKSEATPSYAHYGIGYYPGALCLYARPDKMKRWIKPIDYVRKQVHKHIQIKHGNEVQPENMFIPGDTYAIVNNGVGLFSIKLNPNEGHGMGEAQMVKNGDSSFRIMLPSNLVGKKVISVETMCGDSEARPDRAAGTSGDATGDERNKVRRGMAQLVVSMGNWKGQTHEVAPQMVTIDYPKQVIKSNDFIQISVYQDTAYIMGWRVTVAA